MLLFSLVQPSASFVQSQFMLWGEGLSVVVYCVLLVDHSLVIYSEILMTVILKHAVCQGVFSNDE